MTTWQYYFAIFFNNLFHSKVELEPETSPEISLGLPFKTIPFRVRVPFPTQLRSCQIFKAQSGTLVDPNVSWQRWTMVPPPATKPPWSLPKLDVGQQVCITDNPSTTGCDILQKSSMPERGFCILGWSGMISLESYGIRIAWSMRTSLICYQFVHAAYSLPLSLKCIGKRDGMDNITIWKKSIDASEAIKQTWWSSDLEPSAS